MRLGQPGAYLQIVQIEVEKSLPPGENIDHDKHLFLWELELSGEPYNARKSSFTLLRLSFSFQIRFILSWTWGERDNILHLVSFSPGALNKLPAVWYNSYSSSPCLNVELWVLIFVTLYGLQIFLTGQARGAANGTDEGILAIILVTLEHISLWC